MTTATNATATFTIINPPTAVPHHPLAVRHAPVTMSWFVYMSTLGNPHVDYLVTDSATVPEDLAQHMSGHMLYLPETFFPNSHAFMFPLSDIEGTSREL